MIAAKDRNTRSAKLVEQLRRRILSSRLRPGERFMTEEQVARMYKVSRGIAREAVSHLRALGALESRQGKGMLIRRADPAHAVARCLPFYPHSADDLSSLSRLRYVIEIGAVDLVIAGASDEQIESLNCLARDYAALVDRAHGRPKIRQINQLDLSYHQMLLEMTQDPLVTDMHQVLSKYFHLETQTRRSWQPQQASVWEHSAIAQAITDRDAEQARALLRQHLKGLLSSQSDQDRGEC